MYCLISSTPALNGIPPTAHNNNHAQSGTQFVPMPACAHHKPNTLLASAMPCPCLVSPASLCFCLCVLSAALSLLLVTRTSFPPLFFCSFVPLLSWAVLLSCCFSGDRAGHGNTNTRQTGTDASSKATERLVCSCVLWSNAPQRQSQPTNHPDIVWQQRRGGHWNTNTSGCGFAAKRALLLLLVC